MSPARMPGPPAYVGISGRSAISMEKYAICVRERKGAIDGAVSAARSNRPKLLTMAMAQPIEIRPRFRHVRLLVVHQVIRFSHANSLLALTEVNVAPLVRLGVRRLEPWLSSLRADFASSPQAKSTLKYHIMIFQPCLDTAQCFPISSR